MTMLTVQVVVHQASTEHMDFVSKNFRYVTQPFGQFMEAVDAGEMLYLRSLSAERPSELPADLGRDFPAIANDFRLPPELKMAAENTHSSALRISGPVNMWLHYDVGISISAPTSSDACTGHGQCSLSDTRSQASSTFPSI